MQEQRDCPNCGQGVDGFIITFSSERAQRDIKQTILSELKPLWRVIDERRLWLRRKLVYDLLPYWQEFYHLSDWEVRWGTLKFTGEVEEGQRSSWSEIASLKPTMFVDDVIQTGQIRMMMQPIVDVMKRKTIAYEMLARSVQTDGSVISPAELYQSAREQNQLFRLDRACRIAAIETVSKVPDNQLVFINFVPTSIYVPEHCLATTVQAAERCGVERHRIVFEVVETDHVEDLSHLRSILSYYREKGFQCALDDFGEGFSDEETMDVLRPDIVKLDRKYVTDIHKNDEKRRTAESIYHQGRKAGATMLAEGVECEEEAVTLAEIGYTLQQGYWYGKPAWLPVDVDPRKFHVFHH